MRKFYSRIFVTLVLAAFSFLSNAQTVLINPASDGGFELGADFAANGWTVANGTQTNKWFVGTVATPSAGTNSAYISNSATGAAYSFTNTTSSTVHFYKDVTFPAGEGNIVLTFKWKAGGESVWDYLAVWSAPTTVTPAAGSPVAGNSAWNNIPTTYPGATLHGTHPYNLQSAAYNTATICLPASYAGTTRRLVFTWINDGSGGVQPPGSIDEVSLVTSLPPAAPASQATGLTFNSISTSSISGSFTPAAGSPQGYIVVQYPDGATPVAPANNTIYTVGQNLGSGTILSVGPGTSFTSNNLNGGTTYNYYVYAYNGNQCAGPFYNTTSPLTASQATLACAPLAAGTYSVGPTGTYTTLGAALAAASNGTTGTVVFELQPTYTSAGETFPLTITAPACTISSLIIRPAAGATNLIISSSNTTATIDFTNVRNVTIDGRPGGTGTTSQLSVINTSTSGVAIRFVNDARFNTVTYTDIQGQNTSTTSSGLSGVVYFGTAGVLNGGNDGNTLSFNSIHGTATGFPAMGISAFGSTSSVGAYNDSNTVVSNNIYDFFSAGAATSGIKLDAGNNAWNISSNSFYQTAARVYTTTNTHRAIWVTPNTGSIANTASGFTVSNNFIGGNSPNAAGTPYTMSGVSTIFNGMDLSVGLGTPTSVQGNIINNIVLTTASTGNNFVGITIANGNVNIGTTTGNTIGSTTSNNGIIVNTTAGGSTIYGIRQVSGGVINIANNTIGGFTVGGAGTISANFVGILSTTGSQVTISNNVIGSTTLANSIILNPSSSTTAQTFNGISITGGTTSSVSGNTVANILNGHTGATTTAVTRGIQVTSSATSITNNTVRNITSTSPATGTGINSALVGIGMTSTNAAGANVTGNTIHSLVSSATSTTAATQITGLFYSGTGSFVSQINKNFIHSFDITAANTNATITGIDFATATAVISNNMIRLGIRPVGTSLSTEIIVRGISSNSSTVVNQIYHNSIYIGGTGVGTAVKNSYAFIRTSTSGTYDIRNNIFVNARSNASTGGKHYAVYLTTSNTGVSPDYNVYLTNGTGGVFAFNGTADVPNYTPGWIATDIHSFEVDPLFVNPTGNAATVNLHLQVGTVAEGTGVDIPSVTEDFDSEVRASLTPVDIGADAGNFGISGLDVGVNAFISPVPGTCYGPTQTVSVRLRNFSTSAIDFSTNPVTITVNGTGPGAPYTSSIVINSGTLAAGAVQTVTLPATIDMTAPGTYSFTATSTLGGDLNGNNNGTATSIVVGTGASLNGTYNVGTGQGATGGFETLTAAVAAYNGSACIGGNVVFQLMDPLYSTAETFPISINNVTNGNNYTLTIRPAAGVNPTITGSSTSGLIRLNGADNVIIDGSNNGTNSRDLTIINTSTGTSSAVIWINSVNAANAALNNTIKNTILTGGSTTATLAGIVVSGNTINAAAEAANSNTTIQNNQIQKALNGILISGPVFGQSNFQVINNLIGSATATDYIGQIGISINNTNGSNFSGNTIFNIIGTQTNPTGINIFTNVINSVFDRNTIRSIRYTGTSGYGGKGFDINTGQANSNLTISNNMISDLRGDSWSSFLNDAIIGIRIGARASGTVVTGGIKLYHNSVNLGSGSFAGSTSGTLSTALYLSATTSNLDIRNNILVTNLVNTAVAAKTYAIATDATAAAFTAIDNNVYFVSGSQGVLARFGTTDITTLAGIQAAFGGNQNSLNIQPVFVSDLDLHMDITSNQALDDKGTPVGVLVDIDNQPRSITTPDVGADEFEIVTGIDFGATVLVTPVVKDCYGPAETVTIRIRNLSANTHNFSLVPVTVNASATGPNPVTFTPVVINTGTLAPGDSMNVVVSTNYDMTAIGTYTFNAFTSVAADVTPSNDAMAPVIRTLDPINAGVITTTSGPFCITGTPILTLTGFNGTIQWQESTSATGPWTNVGTGTGVFTPSAAITTTTYYQAIVTCNANIDTSNVVQVVVNTPTLTGTTPGSRCGPGTVTLSAAGSPASTTFNWYSSATGGQPLFTGANFTTPVISSTTTYYVSATSGGVTTNVGKTAYTSNDGTNTAGAYLIFDAISSFTLNSVVVYPGGTGAGTLTINLQNSSGTTLQTATVNLTGSSTPVATTVPLNFSVTPGTNYRLTYGSSTGGVTSLYREFTAIPFPYTVPGVVSIKDGSLAGFYYYFYNWQISTGCETARQAVTATVTPGPAFNVTDSVTICNNDIQALTVNSPASNFDSYVWTPSANLFTDAAATIPYTGGSATTVYVRTATAGTYWYTVNALNNGTSCTGIDSVKVVVLPANVTIQATPTQICTQGTSFLSITPATGYQNAQFQWQVSTNGGTSYTDITGATGSTYATAVLTQTSLFRVLIKNSAGVVCQQPTVTITVNTPQVLTSAGAINCGPGSVTLNATGSAGTTLNWYTSAQGGAPVGTGTTFTTPNLTATTTYYVSATSGGAIQTAGPTSVTTIGGISAQTTLNSGIRFDVINGTTPLLGTLVQSVDIFPTSPVGTAFQIAVIQGPPTTGAIVNGANGQPLVYNGVTTVSGSAANPVAQTVPVNFQVPSGFDYIMVFKTTNPGALRNSPATTAAFPYSITNEISLTGSTTANTYQFFYNWRIGSGCESPRTAVTATISANTAITAQPTAQSICSGATLQLVVGGQGAGLSFQWFKDGQAIANSNNDTLTIPNAQTSNSGVYSVVLTGSCGTVTSQNVTVNVSGQNTWLGAVSSDWHTAANWCGSIPTQTSDIVIPAGTPFQPVVNALAEVRNINVNSGASLTLQSNGFLNIWGNYQNQGTLNAQTGFLGFKGTTIKTTTAITANTVVINGTGGVSLQGDWTIGTLILETGNVRLNGSSLAISTSSTGTVASHILTNGVGSVRALNVTSTRTVAVGADSLSYNPVVINNGQGRDYTVRVVTGIQPTITLPARAINRTWTVLPSSAVTSPVELTFQWADAHGNASVTAGGDMEVGVNANAPGGFWNILTPPGGLTPSGGSANRAVTVLTTAFGSFVVSSPGGFTYPLSTPGVDVEVSSVQLMPNLVQSQTTMRVKLTRSARVQWSVVDASGKVVRQWAGSYSAGTTDEKLNLINLSKGAYFLMGHTQKGRTQTVRLVKE